MKKVTKIVCGEPGCGVVLGGYDCSISLEARTLNGKGRPHRTTLTYRCATHAAALVRSFKRWEERARDGEQLEGQLGLL